MPDDDDPYEPTRFQESNAILLADLALHDHDAEAQRRLTTLLDEMSPVELRRLDGSARELVDQIREAQQRARQNV